MSIPIKHHHLPVFYLDRWTGEDSQLCQFSRPHNEIVPLRRQGCKHLQGKSSCGRF